MYIPSDNHSLLLYYAVHRTLLKEKTSQQLPISDGTDHHPDKAVHKNRELQTTLSEGSKSHKIRVSIVLRLDVLHEMWVGDHVRVVHVGALEKWSSGPVDDTPGPIRRRELVIRSSVHRSHTTFKGRRSVHRTDGQPALIGRCSVERAGAVLAAAVLRRGLILELWGCSTAPELRVALHLLRLLERLHGVHEPVHDHALGGEVGNHALHSSKLKHALPDLLLALVAAHGDEELENWQSPAIAVKWSSVRRLVMHHGHIHKTGSLQISSLLLLQAQISINSTKMGDTLSCAHTLGLKCCSSLEASNGIYRKECFCRSI
jgi:hypothetical protein